MIRYNFSTNNKLEFRADGGFMFSYNTARSGAGIGSGNAGEYIIRDMVGVYTPNMMIARDEIVLYANPLYSTNEAAIYYRRSIHEGWIEVDSIKIISCATVETPYDTVFAYVIENSIKKLSSGCC